MKQLFRFLVVLNALFLVACTPLEEEPKEDNLMNQPCSQSTNSISISSTTTLDARTLWQHAVSCENIEFNGDTIVFKEGATTGSIQTGVFVLEPFSQLVPSWNIIIDENVKVRIKVAVGTTEELEEPFLMSYWTNDYKLSMNNQENIIASVSIDTIIAKDTPLRFVSFTIEFEAGAFNLKSLSLTTKQPSSTFTYHEDVLHDVDIDVPTYQQLSVPVIGSSICSPTSLTMVLAYYNHLFTPATVAGVVRDEGAQIYGNWSFNTSYAGGFEDLYSRVEYITDMQTILDYLDQGTPLILSIKTTSKEQLEGSLMSYSSGHLVVLRGIVYENDQWIALVNDPASYTDETVLRHYPLDQLLTVWRGYAYVIQNKPFQDEVMN